MSYRLQDAERARLEQDGFVVRDGAFTPADVRAISEECESLVDKLVAHRQGKRVKFGSYTFDADTLNDTIIKWEGDSDIVHGIEPFVHLSPRLNEWAMDPRFVDPMKDILGVEQPELFTEKLNLKRPRHGGSNPMHQDHPYWVGVAEEAADVYTAMLFLDDATLENGCLHVVPGSHKDGEWVKRSDGDRFAGHEVATDRYPGVQAVPVAVSAGAVVFFGSYLVHQSAPNHSDKERRAILYSYQPPGRRTQLQAFRAGWKARAG